MTVQPAAAFIHDIAVEPAHVDFMGHVNNAVYLTFVQDAVIAHWRSLTSDLEFSRYLWVALRHEIDYVRPAFAAENLTAHVKLVSVEGVRAWYETAIQRGDELIATARSCWCSLDGLTRRPVRLARDLVQRFLPEL